MCTGGWDSSLIFSSCVCLPPLILILSAAVPEMCGTSTPKSKTLKIGIFLHFLCKIAFAFKKKNLENGAYLLPKFPHFLSCLLNMSLVCSQWAFLSSQKMSILRDNLSFENGALHNVAWNINNLILILKIPVVLNLPKEQKSEERILDERRQNVCAKFPKYIYFRIWQHQLASTDTNLPLLLLWPSPLYPITIFVSTFLHSSSSCFPLTTATSFPPAVAAASLL